VHRDGTVLGRVEKPGVQRFNYRPHLLELLANAGSMPILDKQATLTQSAIIRDNKQMIWVDLKALLNGNMAYNLKMKRGDLVFIPDSSETSIYVMGQVLRPNAYRLTPRMTLLDAIAQAGGPNEDAARGEILIYRPGTDQVKKLSLEDLMKNAKTLNYELQDRDVIYVEKKSMANLGYVLKQIAPGISVLSFIATMKLISK
jgi:polysaccharide export outer membrane protein